MVQVRNRFFSGEILETVSPGMQRTAFRATAMRRPDGMPLEVAQPNDWVIMDLPPETCQGDLLRREKPPQAASGQPLESQQ